MTYLHQSVQAHGCVKDRAEEQYEYIALHPKETQKAQDQYHSNKRIREVILHRVKLLIKAFEKIVDHYVQICKRH